MSMFNLVEHTFVVRGLPGVPLLMANCEGKISMGSSDKQPAVKKTSTPEKEAEGNAYRLPSGQLYGPAAGFRKGIILGAKGKKFGKLGAPGVILGTVFCVDGKEQCPLVHPKAGKPITDYKVDSRTAVNQTNRARIMVHRPKIMEWETEVTFQIDLARVETEVVLKFFQVAGIVAGWLAFRPEKGGGFGRYTVELKE